MTMDAQRRAELIARYREGPTILRAAVAGLDEAGMDHVGESGEWSARQVIHHVADSEMMSAMRLRRLLAEENADIQGYDEAEFARALHYDTRPAEPSLQAVEAARATTADLLDRMSDADWSRSGTHSDTGPYGVERWLEIYADHCHDHAEQARRASGRA
ncbi:MAG: DinB family protein [Candidatus Limnocylindrales bacterium]